MEVVCVLPEKVMNRLKEILDVLELSQVKLARLTGLSEAAISNYVKGDREPTLTAIQAILNVLPCSYETIWGKRTRRYAKDDK